MRFGCWFSLEMSNQLQENIWTEFVFLICFAFFFFFQRGGTTQNLKFSPLNPELDLSEVFSVYGSQQSKVF